MYKNITKKYRRNLTNLIVLALMTLITLLVVVPLAWTSPNPSKGQLKKLGNPLLDDGVKGRALNIWDLQAFAGKIYLGGGSTVSNAGPINVWAYDPNSQKFIKEYAVDEEAIEHYKLLDNQLYIPAADPTQGDSNKFYRRQQDGQWQKYASEVVQLAHVRDLIKTNTNDILLVGNNRQPGKPSRPGTAIATKTEDGLVFQGAGIKNIQEKNTILVDFNWFFSTFEYQQRIYATNSVLRDYDNYAGSIAEYDSQSRQFKLNFSLHNDELIPPPLMRKNGKYGIEVIYRPWNPVEFQNYLVYPVRSYSNIANSYRQAYMNTLGFFYKSGMGNSPQELTLPQAALGEDVLIIDNELYVLANKQEQNGEFTIFVFKTDHLDQKIEWQQLVEFSSPNKARSFEYLDNTFYFGLGQDYGDAIANSGDILSYTLP